MAKSKDSHWRWHPRLQNMALFQWKIYFFLKGGQTGPNRAKQVQTGANSAKHSQTRHGKSWFLSASKFMNKYIKRFIYRQTWVYPRVALQLNMTAMAVYGRAEYQNPSIRRGLSLKVVFHLRLSSIIGCLPTKVVLHRMSSSIEGHLPSRVIFHQGFSSIKGHLPSKVLFHRRLSSIKGPLPSLVVYYLRW